MPDRNGATKPVDVHNHVMPTQALDLLTAHPQFGVSIVDGQWHAANHVPFPIVDSFVDPAAKIGQLDDLAIAVAVTSVPPTLFFYEVAVSDAGRLCAAANEGLRAFCAQAPDRLRWLATLPMQDPDRAVQAYREAVRAGCLGAAIGTSIAGRRLDEAAFEAFWAAAAELGRPVLLHPAFNEPHPALSSWYLQNVIGNPLETTLTAERLLAAGVLTRHPALRLILLHGGGFLPYQMGRLQHARQVRPELVEVPEDLATPFRQLYFDTITHDDAALRFLVHRVGGDRVVLGTDMPFDMAMQTPMRTLRKALDDYLVHQVADHTPRHLFGLD